MIFALLAGGGFPATPLGAGKSLGPEGPHTACPSWQLGAAFARAFCTMLQIVVPLMSENPEHRPESSIFWQLPVPSWIQAAIKLKSTFWPSKVGINASWRTAGES